MAPEFFLLRRNRKGVFMKKGILVLLVFVIVTGSAFAFDILSFPAPVQPGAVMIDAGIGLRHLTYIGHKISIPPLFAQGEFALPVGVPLSVGGGISVAQWKWNYWGLWGLGDYGYKVTYITPHTRVNWHWGFDIPWLDFYTGMSLGWNIATYKWHGDYYGFSASAKSGFYWAFQAGAHFYFTQNIGAMVETGYPYWIKAGIAFKIGGSGAPRQQAPQPSLEEEEL